MSSKTNNNTNNKNDGDDDDQQMEDRRPSSGPNMTPTAASSFSQPPLASSHEPTAASAPASPVKSSWALQLQTYLNLMVVSKKSAKNKEVARYYKKQQKMLKAMIEANELQENYEGPQLPKKISTSMLGDEEEGEGEENHLHPSAAAAAAAADGKPIPRVKKHAVPGHEDDDDDDDVAGEEEEEEEEEGNYAAMFSLLLNVCLLAIKIYAAVISGSLVVVASLLDSALDLVSGALLAYIEHIIATAPPEDFPTGFNTIEAVATLVFSCCMFVASAKLVEDSATKLADINKLDLTIDDTTIGIMAAVVGSKLIAYILCCRNKSTIVQALAQDHRNDVVANAIGLAGLFAAKELSKYVDPAVALCVTLFIMFVWFRSAWHHAKLLSGQSADVSFLNELTMLALKCDVRVVAVDTVRAVSFGTRGYLVEIDIVLPPEMPLRDAHDIGEKLQTLLERSEPLGVARAYVHLDWETDHCPRGILHQ